MYHVIHTHKSIGKEFVARYGRPALLLADEYGGVVAVVNDDHCWLALQGTMPDRRLRTQGPYERTWLPQTHLFVELFTAMKDLPEPR